MRAFEPVIKELKSRFSKEIIEVRILPFQDTVIKLSPEDVRTVVVWLLEHSDFYHHLSTLTGLDNGSHIEVYYHFLNAQGLSLHTELPRKQPTIDSIADLISGASFYEREVYEMLGVHFSGSSKKQNLLMADDWDGQSFPLRKNDEEQNIQEDR